jgi:amidase
MKEESKRLLKPSSAEILSWDAITLSNAIQEDRIISCHDLMLATLNRIDALNPKCNAIVLLQDRDTLLAKAQEADGELQLAKHRGWLHGIPVAIKDLFNAKGFPTTKGGSRLFADHGVATHNDAHVERLVKAGAIVIGKTNTPEGGLGSNTFNDRFGATLNPFGLSKSAGGSSGGAAVAVASKMLAVADGSDNLGSLRNPAGWNDIYSIRPTAGLVPADERKGETSVAETILTHPDSTAGPMARTPKDVALLLQTMVGDSSVFDASSVVDDSIFPLQQNSIRIGWLGDWGGSLPFEDGILSRCFKGLDVWSASAATQRSAPQITVANVEDSMPLFPFEEVWEAYNTVRFSATVEKYSDDFDVDELIQQRGTLIKEELAWEMEQGKLVTEQGLMQARDVHRSFADAWLKDVMQEFDVLALPSAQVWPFPVECRYPECIGDTKMVTYHQWMQVCAPVSFAGLPCVTVPAGFSDEGLPMGIQLFGSRGDDLKLLSFASAYHVATKDSHPKTCIAIADSAVLSISKR